jgi:hypothetical protein
MIRFHKFIKILSFILTIYIVDLILGYSLKELYFNQKGGLYYRSTYSIDSTKADVLVFGASTANHHYDPDVFENRLGMSFYSTGRDGMSIYYFLAVQEAILQRYTPKLVILDFNVNALYENIEDFDRLSGLLPYFGKSKALDSIVLLRSPYERVKLFSKIYPYNSTFLTLLKGKKNDNSDRGYIKNDKVMIPSDFKILNNASNADTVINRKIDESKVLAFRKFLYNCKNNDIEVVIISPPQYYYLNRNNTSYIYLKNICVEKNVQLFDYANDKYSGEKFYSLYADPGHLNSNGANVFSNDLCDSIINYNLLKK